MEESAEQTALLMQCPECGKSLDVAGLPPYARIECPHCAAHIRVRTSMGQYEIVGLLGEGGMSQVFRAVDRTLGREVALKVLHQSLGRDTALTAMFEREAKLTASIVHPNVVKVYSVGQDQGYFYIAMELLEAISLEHLIGNKGALSEPEVLAIALDVACGLRAAHEEQLIHRDIKPGNMLVTGDGTTKLVDFGLALQQGGEELSEDLWATPFYVSPEKLEGETDTFLGDIYSLGATLFHALAGKPPFDANTPSMEELKEIKRAPVDLKAAAPGLSKATVRLVEKMMAYRPEDRIPGYDELISQIEHVRSRQFGVAGPRRGTRADTRSARPRKGVWLAAAGVAAVIAIAVLALRPRPVEEPEIGIQTGERAVAVGDNTISGQFLSARGHLVAGRFGEAGKAFETLAANEAVTGSTKVWSLFLIGMNRLFVGDLGPAREAFQSATESTTEVSPENAEAVAFLKRAAKTLAEPLPVLPGDAAYDPGSVEAIGLLAAGLKNWQHGEFSSAVDYLKAFQQAEIPESVAWMRDLKKRVEPFLADHALIAALPNPRASSPAPQLAAEEETLRKGLDSLRTKGAALQMLKRRIDRIAEIRKL